YCKLLATIARHDWPDQYPEFLPQILKLLNVEQCQQQQQQNPNSVIHLGLALLGMAVEELSAAVGSNSHHQFERQIELCKQLEASLPPIMESLSSLIGFLWKSWNLPSATPPPSPNHSPTHSTPMFSGKHNPLFRGLIRQR